MRLPNQRQPSVCRLLPARFSSSNVEHYKEFFSFLGVTKMRKTEKIARKISRFESTEVLLIFAFLKFEPVQSRKMGARDPEPLLPLMER
jgi:hypothetical protein